MDAKATGLDAAVRSLFERPNFVHVATLMHDGSPHAFPVWIRVEGELLVFMKEESSLGLRNIERDPRVALSVVDHDDPYRMGQARGTVVDVRRGDGVREWIDVTSRHYTGARFPYEDMAGALVAVRPTSARVHRYEAFGASRGHGG